MELLDRAIAEACSGVEDDDAYWAAVRALRSGDPDETWAAVAPLHDHTDARVRALVPNVFRYLDDGRHAFDERTVNLLGVMLCRESDVGVLEAIAQAFIDLRDPRAVELLRPLAVHPVARVREAAVHGLLPVAAFAVPELIVLSRDSSSDVRNWATFGLGTHVEGALASQGDVIRDALAERLGDEHSETRAEAAVGLARLGDRRALPVVRVALEGDAPWEHYLEAAERFADPSLQEALLCSTLREDFPDSYDRALTACRPR